MPSNGASDITVVPVPLDAILTNVEFVIGKTSIVVGRMDIPFRLAFRDGAYAATVDRPISITSCNGELIDSVFITTASAAAGGLIELWTSNPTQVA